MSTQEPQAAPLLSIIIPAYNEERRLPVALRKIEAFLANQPYRSEVLVVENGSTDRTTEVAESFAADHPYVRVLHSEKGKGAAVRKGMLAASGEYRFMCDADLSMPIDEVNKFLPPVVNSYAVAMASREAPGANRYNEPFYRHLMGRVFNQIVRWLAIPQFQDTQCGFKCFRGDVAAEIFTRQTMNGLGFDVEAVAIALARGHTVIELPINWYFDADSRVRPVHDTVRMVREVWQVRRNLRDGVYTR
ncbi:MAG: glycosyltransferase family 2 protein [Caldilineales bacterium]